MNAVLFEPLGIDLFQLLAIVSFVAAVCTIIGMAWGGRARDDMTLHFGCHTDVQAAARAGLIERRRVPRVSMVTIRDPDRPSLKIRVRSDDPRAIKAAEIARQRKQSAGTQA